MASEQDKIIRDIRSYEKTVSQTELAQFGLPEIEYLRVMDPITGQQISGEATNVPLKYIIPVGDPFIYPGTNRPVVKVKYEWEGPAETGGDVQLLGYAAPQPVAYPEIYSAFNIRADAFTQLATLRARLKLFKGTRASEQARLGRRGTLLSDEDEDRSMRGFMGSPVKRATLLGD